MARVAGVLRLRCSCEGESASAACPTQVSLSSPRLRQAFIEGLRYYPDGRMALDSNDCEATYSGNTHHKRAAMLEHIETDLRSRLDIAPGAPHSGRK